MFCATNPVAAAAVAEVVANQCVNENRLRILESSACYFSISDFFGRDFLRELAG